MPPPTQITGFDPRFFRPCIFPVLGRFGYGTRVTLNNGVGPESGLATPMTVSFSTFDENGSLSGTIDRVAERPPSMVWPGKQAPSNDLAPSNECLLHGGVGW